jgi:mutator protein MutT
LKTTERFRFPIDGLHRFAIVFNSEYSAREHAGRGNRLIRVVAGLIEKNGRLLICQRRRGGLFELQWEFPGGKLRRGEKPQAGLMRELREELGAKARIGSEVHRTRHEYREHASIVEIIFFQVLALSASPRNLVFERMVWARPGELTKYDFLPADRELVARLASKELRLPKQSPAKRAPGQHDRKADSSLRSE